MKEDLETVRHDRSVKDYPELKLEDNEYVELKIKRSKIGLILLWSGVVIGCLILIIFVIFINNAGGLSRFGLNEIANMYLSILLMALCGFLVIVGFVAHYVYKRNILYITNRRVIQETQVALFAKSKNVIELLSVEDVSFKQTGILQHLFRFGTIRMATVGDETTYTFPFVDTPTDELDTITHLVHLEKEKTKETK